MRVGRRWRTIAGMLCIVDGYNVTRSDPATASCTAEEQRDRLVARLRARGAGLLGPGRIVVVFDGSETAGGRRTDTAPVEVRFSRGESADDVMVRLASQVTSGLRLVSSDCGLVSRVKAVSRGPVEVRGSDSVYESARDVRRQSRRMGAADDGEPLGTPPGGRRITAELERLWLDEKGEG